MIDHKYCRGQSIFAAVSELDVEFMLFSAAWYRPLCYYRFWFKCSFPAQGAKDASPPIGDLSIEAGFPLQMSNIVRVVWDQR